ncbi:MAG: cation:proton antiporter, partial [Bacteroidota bacterium]
TMHDISLPLTEPVVIFMVVLLIVLIIPVVLRKTNVPSIIGLIIAGIIMGPHALNIIADNDTIELFSHVGLLYIMFLAGLEIEFSEFRKNSLRGIFFGIATFVLPFFLGYYASIYLLSLSMMPSILIGIMLSSNTLIAFPSISQLGITKSSAVNTAISGTVIADTLVLIMLAFVTALMNDGESNRFLLTFFLSFGSFTFAIFFLLPKLSRWFFRNIAMDGYLQYLFTLSVLFASAYAAELAGAEPIIGAFFAGLALNRLIPSSSALMNRIDFVGNTLFIPFFLISVGMLVNLGVLFTGFRPILYAVLFITLAISSKWMAAWVTKVIFRQTKAEMDTIFGLTSARAAATLAVAMVGLSYGVLNEDIFNGVILLILGSSLFSSLITEKAGRDLVREESEKLPVSDTIKQRRILVPIANPENIEKLIDLAILLSDPKLTEPVYPLAIVKDDADAKNRIARNKSVIEKLSRHAAASGISLQSITRVDVNIPLSITRVSKELNISEIIMGWSGRTREMSRIFGNMVETVLNRSNNTVIVAHLPQPLSLAERIYVFVPENAELEKGFPYWMNILSNLCEQLSASVTFNIPGGSGDNLEKAIRKNFKDNSSRIVRFTDWNNAWELKTNDDDEPMYVIINARTHTMSYTQKFFSLTFNLPSSLSDHNVLNIYPQQYS